MRTPGPDFYLLASALAARMGRQSEGMSEDEARQVLIQMGIASEDAGRVIDYGLAAGLFQWHPSIPDRLRTPRR